MTTTTCRFIFVLAVVLVTGCGGTAPPNPAAVAPAAIVEPDNEGEVVRLDAAAQKEAGVVVRVAENQSLPEVIRATGRITINDNETWRVGAVTAGRITELYATEGDQIEKGQVLGRLYSHDIHEARAEYDRAVSELDRLNANLEYTKSIRDRTRRLLELKAASVQQLEQSEAELRNAETAVAQGEVELERTRVHLEDFLGIPAEESPKSGVSEEDQHSIPIIAPAAGTLLERDVTAGTVVEPSRDLFVITNLNTLWTMAAVAEEYLSKLHVGMRAKVYVQAYPNRAFRGTLTKLDTELDPTTRTIMARVETPNRDGLLKPEMYATVEMELPGTRQAIFVPEVAVQEVNGEPTVFVRTGPDRFEPRMVTTLPGAGGEVEVARGLRAGEEVVVEGSFLLKSQLLKSTLGEE